LVSPVDERRKSNQKKGMRSGGRKALERERPWQKIKWGGKQKSYFNVAGEYNESGA